MRSKKFQVEVPELGWQYLDIDYKTVRYNIKSGNLYSLLHILYLLFTGDMMTGWLIIHWKWLFTLRPLMMMQTVSNFLTVLTLFLWPLTVRSLKNGPVWWEFTPKPIRSTQGDLYGGTYLVPISFTTLVKLIIKKNNKTLKNNRNFFTMESRCSPI